MKTDNLEMELQSMFPGFGQELITKLEEIGQIVEFNEGDMLMRPGQYYKNSILILDGRVKVYREGEDGEEFFLYFLERGAACALSMICAATNEASVVKAKAMTHVTALNIPIRYMDHLIKYRDWYAFVLQTYRSRFNELLEVIDQVVFHSMDEKLENYLRRQFRSFGNRVTITHQEIADDLNSSREVISRLLKKLEKQNRITVSRNEIERLNL